MFVNVSEGLNTSLMVGEYSLHFLFVAIGRKLVFTHAERLLGRDKP